MLSINKIATIAATVCSLFTLTLAPSTVTVAEGGFATSVGIVGVLTTNSDPLDLVVTIRLIRDDGRVKWQAAGNQISVTDQGNMLRYSVNLQPGDWNLNGTFEWSIRVDARTAETPVTVTSLAQLVDQNQITTYGNGANIQGAVGEVLLSGLTSTAYTE